MCRYVTYGTKYTVIVIISIIVMVCLDHHADRNLIRRFMPAMATTTPMIVRILA